MTERLSSGIEWHAENWEQHRQRQLTLGLGATPAERLAWLEDMLRLAHACGVLPRRPSQLESVEP